jgi:hypothetical protein
MGPGAHPFTRFGHNALLLEWDDSGSRHVVHNFGTFAFDGWSGVMDFMAGRFRYWLSVTSLENTLRQYAAEHRTLAAQELELSPEERLVLFRALQDNARPEHRYYDYDYYRDNCSTRVRDALDNLLQGQLKQNTHGSGRLSFRRHTLALVGDTPWLYLGLDAALGTPTDRAISRWEELFLPAELHDALGQATRELEGRAVPLVRTERTLLSGAPPGSPRSPASPGLAFAGVGAALGAGAASHGHAARRHRWLRGGFAAVTALLGVVLGSLGLALTWFSMSKHWAAHLNPSVLACPPWALALAFVAPFAARGSARASKVMVALLGAALLTSTAPLVWGAIGPEPPRLALLALPLWLGLWWGARRGAPAGSS